MIITVDGLLVAPVFVAQIDELENHYDVRGPYAEEIGRELAYRYDLNVGRMGLLAARTTTNALTGRAGGETIATAAMRCRAVLSGSEVRRERRSVRRSQLLHQTRTVLPAHPDYHADQQGL